MAPLGPLLLTLHLLLRHTTQRGTAPTFLSCPYLIWSLRNFTSLIIWGLVSCMRALGARWVRCKVWLPDGSILTEWARWLVSVGVPGVVQGVWPCDMRRGAVCGVALRYLAGADGRDFSKCSWRIQIGITVFIMMGYHRIQE